MRSSAGGVGAGATVRAGAVVAPGGIVMVTAPERAVVVTGVVLPAGGGVTGTGNTLTRTLSRATSALATMVVDPNRRARSRPVASTETTVVSLDSHVGGTDTPASALMLAATVCSVATMRLRLSGAIWSDSTPRTEKGKVPEAPNAVAEIVADPRLSATTCPAADTVTTDASEDVHVTPVVGRSKPCVDLRAALSCTCCPSRTVLGPPVTVTDPTVIGSKTPSVQAKPAPSRRAATAIARRMIATPSR